MKERISADMLPPAAHQAQRALEVYISQCGLPHDLCELIKLRLSMINGCAFCIDMHWTDLRQAGTAEAKLYGLSAWRELDGYSEQERAALAWAEVVNDVSRTQVPDEAFEAVSKSFSQKDIVDLTYVVVAINGWNRLCVAFRRTPATRTAT